LTQRSAPYQEVQPVHLEAACECSLARLALVTQPSDIQKAEPAAQRRTVLSPISQSHSWQTAPLGRLTRLEAE